MVYKIYIAKDTFLHNKNKLGVELFIKHNYLILTENIDECDIIFYPSLRGNQNSITDIDIYDKKYNKQLILLGPHFSVFPTDYMKTMDSTINDNLIFNTLSNWVYDAYDFCLEKKKLQLVKMPFPVNTELFKPDTSIVIKTNIVIYIKIRKSDDYIFIIDYIIKKYNNIYNIKIFNYEEKYVENNYIDSLKNAKFCIWIGRHESQGFALQEALAMDVPLLVFDVYTMGQENGYSENIEYCRTIATAIPYWSDKCGEKFKNKDLFEQTFDIFISKINNNYYEPRKYILDNLDVHNCFNNYWRPIIELFKLTLIVK